MILVNTLTLFQVNSPSLYQSGNFDAVKQYIQDSVILGEKAVSMIFLHELYGLNPGDSRYRSKLKNRIQTCFPTELLFVTANANKAEIVINKTVFDNGVHHSIDKETSIKEVASTIRSDIITYCNSLPEMSWPPKIAEMEKIDMPDSLRQFLTKLLSSELHSSVGN